MSVRKKIYLAESGELASSILRLEAGWVVAGDTQPLRGYCMLLADPVARDFNALNEKQRAQYALDMGRVGDALLACCGAYRVNYETWGNLDPALHTHIVPRFMDEPDLIRVQPPRQAYDWSNARPFDPRQDSDWVQRVRHFLKFYERRL